MCLYWKKIVYLLVLVMLVGLPQTASAATGDENWDDIFGLPTIRYGTVHTVTVAGENVYIGGSFSSAGLIPANNVARWDGRRWHPLGAGVNGYVYAIAVMDDKVYVGGDFTQAGDVAVNSIAMWDGTTWSAPDAGMGVMKDGYRAAVRALTIADGALYVAGDFDTINDVAARDVARWDGTTWRALGDGLGNSYNGTTLDNSGTVYALAVIDGGHIVAAGNFTSASNGEGPLTVNSAAHWNPATQQWSSLSGGIQKGTYAGDIRTLTVAANGDLYAAGSFDKAGGTTANSIARWDGIAWSTLGSGVAPNTFRIINAVAVVGDTVYAGGDFANIGGKVAPVLAVWQNNTWAAVDGGLGSSAYVFALAASGDGGVYIAGNFDGGGTVFSKNFIKWTGSDWQAMGKGVGFRSISGRVNTIAVSETGQVFIGGAFGYVAGRPAQNVAVWNGNEWSALGNGVDEEVFALAIDGTDVYVGGSFSKAGAISANHIARYDAATGTWSALGSGINASVRALALGHGKLYAGGDFTAAGSASVHYIAQWNGGAWSPLGSGIEFDDSVDALAVAGPDLYIGGSFADITVEGVSIRINGMLRWNSLTDERYLVGSTDMPGVTRQGIGDFPGEVFALAYNNGVLYVGGNFGKAGSVAASAIAAYDLDSGWRALGDSVGGLSTPRVRGIATAGNQVFVGGSFTAAGTAEANYIALWDEAAQQWSALGSGLGLEAGLDDGGIAVAVNGASLYVGGEFETAGGNPSSGFARWGEPPVISNITPQGGGSLASGDGFQIQFPANAVAEAVTVGYQGQFVPTVALTAGAKTLRSFTLTARTAGGAEVMQFDQPYTIRITYTDAELAALNVAEADLNFVYWNGAAWVNMLPCPGCSIDTVNNIVTIVSDHFTEFVLLGNPPTGSTDRHLYLPAISR